MCQEKIILTHTHTHTSRGPLVLPVPGPSEPPSGKERPKAWATSCRVLGLGMESARPLRPGNSVWSNAMNQINVFFLFILDTVSSF